jgi:serpin B
MIAVRSVAPLVVAAMLLGGCGSFRKTEGVLRFGEDMPLTDSQRQQILKESTTALTVDAGPDVVSGLNDLGFKTLALVAEKQGQKNLCVSPLSIDLAVLLVQNGAAGTTKLGIASTLGLAKDNPDQVNEAARNLRTVLLTADPKVKLLLANSLWTQKGASFKPEFLDSDSKFFHADVSDVDFGTPAGVKTINDWVSQKTMGKIPTIIDGPQPGMKLFALNAVYFKGSWTDPFNKSSTKDGDFTTVDYNKIQAPLMHRTGRFGYSESAGAQLLSIPYGSGRLSMVLYLPKTVSDVVFYAKSLDAKTWAQWMSGLRDQTVVVTMPKFKVEYNGLLNEPLEQLGMSDAFSANKADFSGMTGNKGLYISKVIHRVTAEVNEEGTEASAATGIGMMATSPGPGYQPPPPPVFVADHPFLYAIRDNGTGAILFTGLLYDPRG